MAQSAKPVKLLVSGPPKGHFKPLLERLAKLNASAHGPFDACFVLGDFFEGGHAASPDLLDELQAGSLTAPLPVHFVLGSDTASPAVSALLPASGGEVAPNLHFLGSSGVTTVAGLRVAYLSGVPADRRAVDKLVQSVGDSPVDVLLTCQWPQGFHRNVPSQLLPTLPAGAPILPAAGNAVVARLATAVRPRYHFVGQYGVFYTRPPYSNAGPNAGTGGDAPATTTRLVALGDVNTSKDKALKYLHALSITPAAAEAAGAPAPPGTTPNPYTHAAATVPPADSSAAAAGAAGAPSDTGGSALGGLKRARAAADTSLSQAELFRLQQEASAAAKGQQQFFYSGNPAHRQGKRPRGEGRGPPPPRECWFCMSSSGYEKHLVASVADAAYLALPKGGINGDHVLIVPIEHASSLAAPPQPLLQDVSRYTGALAAYFAAKDQFLVTFERVVVTRNPAHTHMQAVGLPRAKAVAAPATILAEGRRCGVPFQTLPQGVTLQEAAAKLPGGPPKQYLFVEVHVPGEASGDLAEAAPGEEEEEEGGGEAAGAQSAPVVHRFLHVVPEGGTHPLQFGRDLLCVLLQLPHRKHWRDCKLSTEEEQGMTGAFRDAFAPFDFAGGEDSSSGDEA